MGGSGIRLHPKLANIDMSKLNVINCTGYPDMQELLCCADAVISDYSSLIWTILLHVQGDFFLYALISGQLKKRGEDFTCHHPIGHIRLQHNNEEMRKSSWNMMKISIFKELKEHHKASEASKMVMLAKFY